MTAENIGVGVHYLSIPEHDYYQQRFGWQPEDYPQARQIGRQTASLPLSAKLTRQDELDVIQAVKKVLASSQTHNHIRGEERGTRTKVEKKAEEVRQVKRHKSEEVTYHSPLATFY